MGCHLTPAAAPPCWLWPLGHVVGLLLDLVVESKGGCGKPFLPEENELPRARRSKSTVSMIAVSERGGQ